MKKTKTHADRRKRLCFTYYDRKPGENCQGLQRPVLEKNNPSPASAKPQCASLPCIPLPRSGQAAGGGAKSRPQDCNVTRGRSLFAPKLLCSRRAAKSRPQDCNRIPGLCPGGGSFSALRKTFLTLANGREGREAPRPVSECQLPKVAAATFGKRQLFPR